MSKSWFTIRERLIQHSVVNPASGCWEWQMTTRGRGYGALCVKGKMKSCHRLSYEAFVSKIPDGLHVLHTCDNVKCLNPKHLFLGTNKDNVLDKMAKGRWNGNFLCGEDRSYAKLTWKLTAEIKDMYESGLYTQEAIAAKLGVNQSTVSRVINRRTWIGKN